MKNSGDDVTKISAIVSARWLYGKFQDDVKLHELQKGVRITYSQLTQEVSSSQLSNPTLIVDGFVVAYGPSKSILLSL